MARILVTSVPVIGHINPLVPIVRALRARGHEVSWYTGAKHRSMVEAAGAQFLGWVEARDYDDAQIEREFPGRARLRHRAAKFERLTIPASMLRSKRPEIVSGRSLTGQERPYNKGDYSDRSMAPSTHAAVVGRIIRHRVC